MSDIPQILIGKGDKQVSLNPRYAHRHGLIAGATGTGKTVTVQLIAEGLSRIGVPVFIADVNGDLSGISQSGKPHPKVDERISLIGIENFEFDDNPSVFWDLYGDQGHALKATVSDLGPALISRLLGLNDTQQRIMTIVFRFADDKGLLLLDLKDLHTILKFIGDNAKQLRSEFGNISSASVSAIQRRLVAIEGDGADKIFGEPKLDLRDLIRVNANGRGTINILAADKLIQHPKLYATFLLWMLSELFEDLPEAGDLDKPHFVFFIDEAHLLFDEASVALIEIIEKLVKLIQTKGVGIYFITQNPLDIPEQVLNQLGNRVQHALRAFTPKEKKSVKATAQTMRQNPSFDAESAITELGVGEALVSTLETDNLNSIVERIMICPPSSRIGPATESERNQINQVNPFGGRYDNIPNREKAHEKFNARVTEMMSNIESGATATTDPNNAPADRQQQSVSETLAKSVVRSIGSQVGRQITRGILGGLVSGNRHR